MREEHCTMFTTGMPVHGFIQEGWVEREFLKVKTINP
jgi:hypothetical protein